MKQRKTNLGDGSAWERTKEEKLISKEPGKPLPTHALPLPVALTYKFTHLLQTLWQVTNCEFMDSL